MTQLGRNRPLLRYDGSVEVGGWASILLENLADNTKKIVVFTYKGPAPVAFQWSDGTKGKWRGGHLLSGERVVVGVFPEEVTVIRFRVQPRKAGAHSFHVVLLNKVLNADEYYKEAEWNVRINAYIPREVIVSERIEKAIYLGVLAGGLISLAKS